MKDTFKDLTSDLLKLGFHDHIYGIYTNEKEKEGYIHSFLISGKKHNSKVIFITNTSAKQKTEKSLKKSGLENKKESTKCIDTILVEKIFYTKNEFEYKRIINLLLFHLEKAKFEGFKGLYVVNDLDSLTGQISDRFILKEYEKSIEQLTQERKITVLCLKEEKLEDINILALLILNHPKLILERVLCKNSLYKQDIFEEKEGNQKVSEIFYKRIVREILEREYNNREKTHRTNIRIKKEIEYTNRIKVQDNVLDYTSSAVAISDENQQIIYANSAFLRLWGYQSIDEIKGKKIDRTIHLLQKDTETFKRLRKQFQEQGKFEGEIKANRLDGSSVWVRIKLNTIKDPANKLNGYIIIFDDITEKSELIEKLKISEKKYRTLFDNSVNPIYIIKLNKDGSLANIVDANHAAYQRLGLTKEEILQKPNNDLFSNASLDLSTLLSKLKKEGYVKFETQINMKDGETVYAEVQATKITLGEEDYVFVTLHDITDRIETFNLLQESERNLKTINKKLEETVQYRTKQIEKMYEFIKNISQLSDINEIMRIIAEYINKFVNFDIFIQIFIEEQINRILIKTPKNNDKLVDELVERTKEKLVDYSTEFMKNKDEITVISSEERIINQISSFTTLPLIVKNNKVIGIFALASEKKEQYEREDLWILNEVANYIASLILKLQVFISARNQLELVFNQATDGMILLNKNKTIVMNNKQNSEMMKFLVDTKNKQIKSEVLDLNNLISTGTKEIENNGTIYIIDVTEIKEKDFITGWLLTIRDVTKEREMQRKIVQHERLATIGRLTGGIAHDFNNILASIIGAADFALMSDENIQNKELLNLIIRQSERGAALVKQMLDFNRQTIANPKPINLQEFFKEFAKIIRTSLPTSIALTLSLKNSTIFMDSIQLQQILMNIILNAKDALPQGGEISIKIEEVPASKVRDFENIDIPQDKNYIHLIIEDDGEGMEK
ncbi:MAG: PAS domain S-box protein, partial [Candidatus Heimdallarchaeaceae archaeon]